MRRSSCLGMMFFLFAQIYLSYLFVQKFVQIYLSMQIYLTYFFGPIYVFVQICFACRCTCCYCFPAVPPGLAGPDNCRDCGVVWCAFS
mmetsp:Transcript_59291/g.165301  ORF Transcript_59291/g.165301 Transcript_59291/m.165301 type:complete len:88 (+) Transcript_59291:80-343(+)